MNIGRIISSLVPAVVLTLVLLLIMHLLIASNMKEPEEVEDFKLPEITMPEREIKTEYDTKKPDKPDEQEEPPPEMPEPEFDTPDLDTKIAVSAPKVGMKVDVGTLGGFGGDGDYLPIVKIAAKYPSRAMARGIEGYCVVEYTVTTTGETRDVVVVDCPETVFAKASVKAAKKFKYKPKVIDGEPIEVAGVRNRFTFELADE